MNITTNLNKNLTINDEQPRQTNKAVKMASKLISKAGLIRLGLLSTV